MGLEENNRCYKNSDTKDWNFFFFGGAGFLGEHLTLLASILFLDVAINYKTQ